MTIKFYKADQAPHTGWKYIGIEGKQVEELLNHESLGTIIAYSYIKGASEFYFDLTGIPELKEKQGKYSVLIRDYAIINKEGHLFGKYEWKQTRKGAHVQMDYYSDKKENIHNVIVFLINALLDKAKKLPRDTW